MIAENALVILMKSCLYSQKPLQVECTKEEFYWEWDVFKSVTKMIVNEWWSVTRGTSSGGFTESSCAVNL